MSIGSDNNKRIAKNTTILYVRMIVVMAITLFTSRIILDLLGEKDYGLNNIINGVVILFSFVNTALLTATQRFLNYYIGKKDYGNVNKVFCMSMNTYFILSIIVLILGETLGLWFINSQLNIPANRIYAAQLVYQFSLIQFILNLIKIPFNASIIAYERMEFYAYVSIYEVIAKLAICYIVYISTYDKLILLSFINTLIVFSLLLIYFLFCRYKIDTAQYRLCWNSKIFKEIFNFSGWSLFGSIANLFAQQGLNVLLNIFYGVSINAAAGIANQVTHAVNNLVSNFQMAYNPQITKAYASNEKKRFENLIIQTSKFAYFLMAIIVFPLIICIDGVLDVWLVNVPDYTGIFCQLILIFLLMDAFMMPMVYAVQATGNIRIYQLIMAGIIFLNFPFAYLLLNSGMHPYCVWYVRILINCCVFLARILYMYKKMNFPLTLYFRRSLIPVIIVTCISLPIPLIIYYFFPKQVTTNIVIIVVSIFMTVSSSYFIGMSKSEKNMITSVISQKILRKKTLHD